MPMITREIISSTLSNGAVLRIEAKPRRQLAEAPPVEEEHDVSMEMFQFSNVSKIIEGIAQEIADCLKAVAPTKAAVEFGLEVDAKSGQLTALLVNGETTAHLKVKLEWTKHDAHSKL